MACSDQSKEDNKGNVKNWQ